MPGLLPDIDPDGLLEFSVVYTDRALNHMSKRFTGVMQDILGTLKEVYHAHTAVLVPGSGTFGMEAVARQIFDADKGLGGGAIVCKARQQGDGPQAPWAPCPAEEVVAAIRAEKPKVVFAPHVETASGIMLSDDYLRTLTAAAHEVGALFVLDCVASGAMWVDMQATGVDVLTTMPTDALVRLRDVMLETREYGFEKVRQEQMQLGAQVRALLESRGFPSVAAEGWKAPGVVVSYTIDPGIQNASKFAAVGLQTASGVPLQCDEGPEFKSFRIGLFGLEKWHNVERTVGHLRTALDRIA